MKEALLAVSLIANAVIGYHAYDVERRLTEMAEDGQSSDAAAWRRQQDLIENRQLKEASRRIKSMEMQVEFLSTMNSIPWTAEEYRAADLSSN